MGFVCFLSSGIGLPIGVNDLTGTIPTEIGKLTRLERLDLAGNKDMGPTYNAIFGKEAGGVGISGSIPSEIRSMTKLKRLNLGYNNITGMISSEIRELSNLQYFEVPSNSLIGTIPASLGELTELTVCNLAYNFITGIIPSELGRMNVATLNFAFNNLTGSVPEEFLDDDKNGTNVKIDVYGNKISDLIPIEGSVICNSEEGNSKFRPRYSGGGGEHYCDCNYDCLSFEFEKREKRCACKEGQDCCSFVQLVKCDICESGMSNPDHRPISWWNPFSFTCKELAEGDGIKGYIAFGLDTCDGIKRTFDEDFGCLCNDDNAKDSEEGSTTPPDSSIEL
mmetsp:Transcript_29005/g.68143  ORF Transcript_29005/g.68143 Transcript_29005/m.68143 type:complete len:336 (+) Transcript_29005:847-1854(+)